MTVAIREIPLSLQVSLSIFLSRLEDKIERCKDQRKQVVKVSKWERWQEGGKKEKITATEKEAKQRGNQSQSHQYHLCLLACLWGNKYSRWLNIYLYHNSWYTVLHITAKILLLAFGWVNYCFPTSPLAAVSPHIEDTERNKEENVLPRVRTKQRNSTPGGKHRRNKCILMWLISAPTHTRLV